VLVGESVIIFSIGNVSPGTLVGAKYFFSNVFRMCSFDLFFDIMIFVFFFSEGDDDGKVDWPLFSIEASYYQLLSKSFFIIWAAELRGCFAVIRAFVA
jgi:hypothetical protein